MALIIDNTNIPTNGSFVFFNDTDIDVVICDGIEVWRKVIETDFINGTDIMDGYTFSWIGNNENKIGQYDTSHNTFSTKNGYYRLSTCLGDDYDLGYSSLVTSTIKWSGINVSGFSKLILKYKIVAKCTDDALLYLKTYIQCGSLSSEILNGEATKPWSPDGSTDKPYNAEGTLELDISSLSGDQDISIIQIHNNVRGYDNGNGKTYITQSDTDIISFELA